MRRLAAFARDGSLHVVVESPRGSSVKFKYDPEHGVMMLSRPLPAGLVYPFDWGFVPGTRAADGDPLDAFILWDASSYPGIVIACRPLGLLKVEQTNLESKRRERNDRVAVIPMKAPRQEGVASVFDLTKRVRDEIEHFFLHAVAFEGKQVTLLGWADKAEAEAVTRKAARGRRSSR
jgi:inorganic pyrophosphatase